MSNTQKLLLDNPPFSLSALLWEGEKRLEGAKIKTARREAETLLSSLLSCRRMDLYLNSKTAVSREVQTDFLGWVKRRSRREPLQYIIGEVDFCGLLFSVCPGVFIPRPETELIVEAARDLFPHPRFVLDLCTGSGALAITLAKRFPKAAITAIDFSPIALATALRNQERHRVPQIDFKEGDLFSPLNGTDRFDLIVCNPPYIADSDWLRMDPEVLEYEPPLALFSPEEGYAHLKRILTGAADFLSQEGHLILEIGFGQAPDLLLFVKNKTSFTARLIQDLSGIDRVLVCQWTKS